MIFTPSELYLNLALMVIVLIVGAVAATYVLRPRIRAHYPGGVKRYVAALFVQSAGFMAPIPVVLVLLIGSQIAPGLDVVLAIVAGVLVLTALRYAPITGPLLVDLHRARVAEATSRAGPRS